MNEAVWQTAAAWLADGVPVTLMIVVESIGSAPGKTGFKMLVAADGRRWGTIGGGIMERKLSEAAAARATDPDERPTLVRQVHHEKAPENQRSGMICAGSQQIAVLRLNPSQLNAVAALAHPAPEAPRRLHVDPRGWRIEPAPADAPISAFSRTDTDWAYREHLDRRPTVVVFGGGHVGLALCKVLALTDFYIVNVDHRENLDTFAANTFAHRKICCAYEEAGDLFAQYPEAYAVVVTTSYPTDAATLRLLARVRPVFTGLMGAAAKIRRIFAELRDEGVDADWLASVAAPVGVSIKNRTPVEIGISITAQLIDVHTRRLEAAGSRAGAAAADQSPR